MNDDAPSTAQATALPRSAIVAVIGAGTMGAGIAQVAAQYGHPVQLYDNRPGAAGDALKTLEKQLDKRVSRGRISAEQRDAILEHIQPCEQLAELASAQLIIEAIVEDLAIKQRLFSDLESICSQETLFATNTSSLSVTAMAATLSDPGRMAGMHFFNPAPVMKLCEIVAGRASRTELLDALEATAVAWGKVAVRVTSTPGFIVNRVARPFYTEAMKVLEEGGSDIATLDALLKEAGGFPMGPFALTDLIGQDINLAVSRSVYAAYHQDRRFEPSLIQQSLVEAGHLGRKSGRGFYDYAEGAERPEPVTCGTAAGSTEKVTLHGDPDPWVGLVERFAQAGIDVQRHSHNDEAYLEFDGLQLHLSDGRTATQRAYDSGHVNTLVFDLAHDYATTPRLGIAAADQAGSDSLAKAAGLFQRAEITLNPLDDIAGLIVMRSVAMLTNLAADAVHKGVCSEVDVDRAMRAGANYPAGPLEWGQAVGLDHVVATLTHLEATYGDGRYRPSPWLKRRMLR